MPDIELTPVNDGFGYYGVLHYDEYDNLIECHICGKWYKFLAIHIYKSHQVLSDEYRDIFQLGTLPLCIPDLSDKKRKIILERVERGELPDWRSQKPTNAIGQQRKGKKGIRSTYESLRLYQNAHNPEALPAIKQAAKKREAEKWTKKTHCKNGHLLTPDSIKILSNGCRVCLICRRHKYNAEYWRNYRAKRRESKSTP